MPLVYFHSHYNRYREHMGGGVTAANVQEYDILVSKFKFKSWYSIHFRTNAREKGMNIIPAPSYVLSSATTALLRGWLWH